MRLAIYCDGNFVVTIPQTFSINAIDKYVISKAQWVISKLDFFEGLNKKQKLTFGNDSYGIYKDKALEMVIGNIAILNQNHYRFKFNKIMIKNQKTRWGSCSRKGNLNFNFKILFLPTRIRDYIIVHELCHLREFNHSSKFWNLVAKSFPDYREAVSDLKNKVLNLV